MNRSPKSRTGASCGPRFFGRPASIEPQLGQVVERHQEQWYAIHAGVPSAEVHRDPDITWMLQKGVAWSNGGTGLRFTESTVALRLDHIIARFDAMGRGVGFWVDEDATPMDLEGHLKSRGLRCRKYFPGMWCDLRSLSHAPLPGGICVDLLHDHGVFLQHPHPYFGRISTPIRRYELARLMHLSAQQPRRVFDFVARSGARPVGVCTVFSSDDAVGFHDVGVLESERRRGIGSALMAHALRFARESGHRQAVLLASGMGFDMYQRVGFREVCRMGYWYRA